jgi:membrane-bound lytic murein transglycosylase A
VRYFLLCFLFLGACARAPLQEQKDAVRLASDLPEISDSYSLESLRDALDRTLAAFQESKNIPQVYQFADRFIPREEYRKALLALKPELESMERFQAFVRANFDFYEVYGSDEWGKIFSTGYYDPLIEGSKKPTERHWQPLYRSPPDMISVDLAAYAEKRPELSLLQQIITEQKSKTPLWRGRLVDKRVIPYFERAEIDPLDGKGPLSGRSLEIAWVDPIDAFFLQIQGSGILDIGGKKLRVGYASQNGFPYVAIGKHLLDVIPLEQVSMQRIRQHLASVSRAELQAILNKNPSYVFFQELSGLSLTYSGAEVTPARTIATDQFFFPKGVLGFLDIELPVFADATSQEPISWERKPRWVFDQDTGGAIRGGGRVDLYMGQDAEAARMAGVMKRDGRLWYAVPKESFLAELRK